MQMESFWRDLSDSQRVSALIGTFILLVTLGVSSIYFLSKEEYSVLFKDLQERDAAVVLQALEKEKIRYRISGGGSEILVPVEDVHRTRLVLMGSDVPINGGVGLEIFNDSSFGTTEFAQKVNFQRALQGELTRTIMALKEVKYARVHLVMPEGGLFKREGQEASASVTLFLNHDMRPDTKQIRGIQRLIAASVPKLSARNVTIVDQTGDVLSEPQVSEEIGMIQGELAQKRALEEYLKSKAEEVLSKAFTFQQFAVSIDVTIDYNESTITTEDVLPHDAKSKQGLLKSKELVSSSDSENSTQPRITREEEYLVGRSVSKTIRRPGTIRKISAGVLLPDSASEAMVAEVRQLVAMSVGVDRERGDNIVVSAVLKSSSQPASPDITATVRELVPDASPQNISGLSGLLKGHETEVKYWLAGGVAFLLSLCALFFYSGLSRRKQDLNPGEREQLLLTLQNWVNTEAKRDNLAEM